ncbi:hypothetical protein ACFL6C_05195, partial [Myxococcota bacterium]
MATNIVTTQQCGNEYKCNQALADDLNLKPSFSPEMTAKLDKLGLEPKDFVCTNLGNEGKGSVSEVLLKDGFLQKDGKKVTSTSRVSMQALFKLVKMASEDAHVHAFGKEGFELNFNKMGGKLLFVKPTKAALAKLQAMEDARVRVHNDDPDFMDNKTRVQAPDKQIENVLALDAPKTQTLGPTELKATVADIKSHDMLKTVDDAKWMSWLGAKNDTVHKTIAELLGADIQRVRGMDADTLGKSLNLIKEIYNCTDLKQAMNILQERREAWGYCGIDGKVGKNTMRAGQVPYNLLEGVLKNPETRERAMTIMGFEPVPGFEPGKAPVRLLINHNLERFTNFMKQNLKVDGDLPWHQQLGAAHNQVSAALETLHDGLGVPKTGEIDLKTLETIDRNNFDAWAKSELGVKDPAKLDALYQYSVDNPNTPRNETLLAVFEKQESVEDFTAWAKGIGIQENEVSRFHDYCDRHATAVTELKQLQGEIALVHPDRPDKNTAIAQLEKQIAEKREALITAFRKETVDHKSLGDWALDIGIKSEDMAAFREYAARNPEAIDKLRQQYDEVHKLHPEPARFQYDNLEAAQKDLLKAFEEDRHDRKWAKDVAQIEDKELDAFFEYAKKYPDAFDKTDNGLKDVREFVAAFRGGLPPGEGILLEKGDSLGHMFGKLKGEKEGAGWTMPEIHNYLTKHAPDFYELPASVLTAQIMLPAEPPKTEKTINMLLLSSDPKSLGKELAAKFPESAAELAEIQKLADPKHQAKVTELAMAYWQSLPLTLSSLGTLHATSSDVHSNLNGKWQALEQAATVVKESGVTIEQMAKH